MLAEISFFISQAIRSPGNIGAVAPSGRALGHSIAKGIGPHSGPVVEIGPGTGSLTRGLLAAGVPEENLILVEVNPDFCAHLAKKFPKARIINSGAQNMHAFGLKNISHIISGLPLLNFPQDLQASIARAAFHILAPKGRLVQFTYGPRPPIHPDILNDLGIRWTRRGKVWANLPPASVYEFYRDTAH